MPPVKECLTLHIGQAGCQLGARTWELFAREHKINDDGTRHALDDEDESFSSFFHATGTGQFVPRAVFVDTEPSVINDMKVSSMQGLFHPESLLSYKKDCKNNFFEGRTMASAYKIQDDVLDRVRLAVELCDNPQGFFVFHALGGGTGSGVGVEVLHDLRHAFGKKAIFQPAIFPSENYSSCIVEPYNCLFSLHYTQDIVDLTFMLDNQAIYKICENNLNIKNPHFGHVNRLIAQCISGATGPLRYETELNATLGEIQHNLIPMQPFRYPMVSLAPIRHKDRKGHERFKTSEIVTELFEEKNFFADVKGLNSNRYLAAVLVLRGSDCSEEPGKDGSDSASRAGDTSITPIKASSVISTLNLLRNPPEHKTHTRALKFVPWMAGSGIKVGIVRARPCIPKTFSMAESERQGVMLGNNTAVRQLFVRQYVRFLRLYYHKAYMWQFIEANGEPDAFEEAKESVRKIIDEYEGLLHKAASEEGARVKGATFDPEVAPV